jgi:hypothetical protein
MKKILIIIICLSILFGTSYLENIYTRENCKITQINDGIATIEDKCGFIWDYDIEIEEIKVGDVVNLKMHTNYTISNFSDDTIKKIILKNKK